MKIKERKRKEKETPHTLSSSSSSRNKGPVAPALSPPAPPSCSPPMRVATASPSMPTTTTTPAVCHSVPSPETQQHVAEARAAVVASIGNLLDSELQSRAEILHDNAAALDRQERDVLRATEGLRRERDKLAREAGIATRGLKELGNVQNWAEVLERGFLVLEETVRLADGSDGSRSGSRSCGCSDASDENARGVLGGLGPASASVSLGRTGPAKEMMDVDVDLANSLHNRENGAAAQGGKQT